MADVLEHIKGSDIITAMDHYVRPNQYYTITVKAEETPKKNLVEWKKALGRLEGLWGNRPKMETKMKEICKEFDRSHRSNQ